MTREERIKIVINNYFKKECSVDTSIREAFEKGFRIGASKVQKKYGKWIEANDADNLISGRCSACGWEAYMFEDDVVGMPFCPNCGAYMWTEM